MEAYAPLTTTGEAVAACGCAGSCCPWTTCPGTTAAALSLAGTICGGDGDAPFDTSGRGQNVGRSRVRNLTSSLSSSWVDSFTA